MFYLYTTNLWIWDDCSQQQQNELEKIQFRLDASFQVQLNYLISRNFITSLDGTSFRTDVDYINKMDNHLTPEYLYNL